MGFLFLLRYGFSNSVALRAFCSCCATGFLSRTSPSSTVTPVSVHGFSHGEEKKDSLSLPWEAWWSSPLADTCARTHTHAHARAHTHTHTHTPARTGNIEALYIKTIFFKNSTLNAVLVFRHGTPGALFLQCVLPSA